MRNQRAKGEGTVYFDTTKNRWVGAVKVNGQRRKVVGKDKTDARRRLSLLLATKNTGGAVINQRTTVATAMDSFMERGLPNRTNNGKPLSPRTINNYQWAAELINQEIGTVRLTKLTVYDIEAMLDRLSQRTKRPLSAASLRKVRGSLQVALAFAQRRGEVLHNPANQAEITPTAARKQPRRSLAPDEARKFLKTVHTERLGPMFALQLRVGLRPGEAAGLLWSDVDGATINITHSVKISPAGAAELTDDLKVESARRTIELPAEMADMLEVHRKKQVAERLAASSWKDERLVFPSGRGTPLHPRNARRALVRLCETAEVTVISPNELRHSCASLLSDVGVPNEHLKDLLGHTTTRMVDSTYRHRLRPVVDVAARSDWTTGTND